MSFLSAFQIANPWPASRAMPPDMLAGYIAAQKADEAACRARCLAVLRENHAKALRDAREYAAAGKFGRAAVALNYAASARRSMPNYKRVR